MENQKNKKKAVVYVVYDIMSFNPVSAPCGAPILNMCMWLLMASAAEKDNSQC